MTKTQKKAVKDIIASYTTAAKVYEMKGDSVSAMDYKRIATDLELRFEKELEAMTDEQLIAEMARKDPEALAKTYADMKGEISRLKEENERLHKRLELADEALCIAQSYRGN